MNAGFAWRGPVIISEEVLEIVEANVADQDIDDPLDSLLVGSRLYSVIVRPGSNGVLRSPTAADYDTANARSKVLAVVDGDSYKVRRTLVDGHAATGTFTIVPENTSLAAGGSGTFRWRGVYTADQNVTSPEEDDIYYNIQFHHWRIRDHDPAYGNYWYTLPNGGEILSLLLWVDYFSSEADALGHVTANGQRVVLQDAAGTWRLYVLSGFTAADPDHYEYSWIPAVTPSVLEDNVTLVDDEEFTFNSANKPSTEMHFSEALEAADDGRPVLIDYRPNAAGSDNRAAGAVILSEHIRHLTTLRPMMLQKTGGGDTPIDHTVDLPAHRPGSIEFPFPISSGGNERRWMRMYYIGDHVDDLDGALDLEPDATTLTLNSTTGITTDTDYWISGPVDGVGCTFDRYDEKVTVTAIGTPNDDDITVIRGVDGTTISDNDCRTFVSGADFIEDNKTTFVLSATHDDQDSGNFTFTQLAQGTGGSGGGTPTPEVLANTLNTDGVDISAQRWDDADSIFELSRAITAADDNREIRLIIQTRGESDADAPPWTKTVSFPAEAFRRLGDHALPAGTNQDVGEAIVFYVPRANNDNPHLNGWAEARLSIARSRRTSGNDAMVFALGQSSGGTLFGFRIKATLH